ncbi:MAG: phosphotransferase [Defluviimonas sp.]|uniref:phosphotransferase n=1 Tax=Albidovulum sp. TaxID=1872424 RepID=UPI001DB79063|nr:phosphotransferase [Paracoccaceae bacterium]MCC0062482.1 phosphotransferase [Defluviimonas sp.]
MPTEATSALVTAPPVMGADAAAALALAHFGLTGTLAPLTSERDLNFRLTAPDGTRHVLKIANPAEPPAVTNFQTEALLHIARSAPDLPVPRVVTARDGRCEITLPAGGTLRLLTWVEGTPLHEVPADPKLRHALGQTSARLTGALADFAHPASGHMLLWDVKNAGALGPMLPAIADPRLAAIARAWLDHFEAHVAPGLHALPWQVVHADLNPWNLLVDPETATISGILDFGDMVRTPRICDLAVAASYHVDAANPVRALADIVGGWTSVMPLLPGEAAMLLDLVAMRMVTTVALASWRAARYPENAAYILRNLPASSAGLAALTALGRGRDWRDLA